MIYDRLENFSRHVSRHAQFQAVLKFLDSEAISSLSVGRYEVDKEGAYAMVSEYDTKPVSEGFIECHRKYIDIQVMIKGTERIGVCVKSSCRELPYDAEKEFQKLEGEVSFITLKAGDFAVFFPQDGHMPQIQIGSGPEKVKKIVFKVPVGMKKD